ncbi:MAG TPA: ABC transporter substrate-binding protein [Polyangia bacterium]|nr:ABC transporter substrate-binding protein [Polyangia bacterium]
MGVALSAVCWPGPRQSLAASSARPLETLRDSTATLRALTSRSFPAWSPEAEARQLAIHRTLDRLINFDELSRRALPGDCAQVPAGSRAEFVRLLRALVEERYADTMTGSQGYHLVLDAEQITGSEARVDGLRVPPAAAARSVPVEYVLAFGGGRWQVVDVVIDGASLVSLYRQQFAQLIKRESFDGLLARLRERLARSDD